MPTVIERPPTVGLIDLTLSDDDDEAPQQVPASHTFRRPFPQATTIPRSSEPPRPTYNVSPIYTSIAQAPTIPTIPTITIPTIPTNHGLLSKDFYSNGLWSAQNTHLALQGNQFTNNRQNEENPAKRMRIGERPTNLNSSHFPTNSSAMPELPINVMHRDVPRHETVAFIPQPNVSMHNALNIVNEIDFPRPPRRKQVASHPPTIRHKEPSNTREPIRRVEGLRTSGLTPYHANLPIPPSIRQAGTGNTNSAYNSEPFRAVGPPRPSAQVPVGERSGSDDVEILEWRRKESPQHKIIRNAQKSQIFPHIRGFLREFGDGVPDDEAKRIGKEVVDKICDGHTIKIIFENKGSLPHEYETQLANRARGMTYRRLMHAKNSSLRIPNSQFGNGLENRTVLNPVLTSQATRLSPADDVRSSSSSEVDAVFDKAKEINRPTPTTSPELSTESNYPKTPRLTDSTKLSKRPQSLSLARIVGEVREDSSESVEEPSESDDEDITVDVMNFLKTLKPRSVTNSPVKVSFDREDLSPPTILQKLKRNRLEREERRYRLSGLDVKCSRPYLSSQFRADLQRGLDIANTPSLKFSLTPEEKQRLCDTMFHVDFATEELSYMADAIDWSLDIKIPAESRNLASLSDDITRIMKGRGKDIPKIIDAIPFDGDKPSLPLALRLIKRRGKAAVTAFLGDAVAGTISKTTSFVECTRRKALVHTSETSISSLLRQRELFGNFRGSGSDKEVKVELLSTVEDTIVPYRQWMDCSGDVIALAWNSEGTSFVCGATAHSDSHNQQYNKPGNLIFGSVHSQSMRARPDHKVPRPVVVKGDNSIEAMRETQDPWLYSSVVSAAYNSDSETFFTSSFDKTVKVWGKGLDETQPEHLGTWEHEGNVNFVVTSENHGFVATAADIVRNAIRVYEVSDENVTNSPYKTYSGMKANEQVAAVDKTWAYYPATIAWAKCPLVSHLLLVGYSPRSTGVSEHDIPEDKANLGELCLWDVLTSKRIDIWPRSQNVFEVVWHPTQPVFFAATAPSGTFEPWVRTQIRVFSLNDKGGFTQTSCLDCSAIDINEITVFPNSARSSYVTASCTDGKVYVWDTALGDSPIHVLEHGASIDDRHDIDLDNELSDNGVKFTAWGASVGRFYTGSSDGLVKAWDVRKPRGQAFIRDVVQLSGGVSSGAFSPNFTHLLIGDATGKIHLLQIQDTETGEEPPKVSPKLITPHPQPHEDSLWAGRGGEISSDLVRKGVVILDENKEIGAVQGPNYHTMDWYCPAAHEGRDPSNALLPEFACKQQLALAQSREPHRDRGKLFVPRLPEKKESFSGKFSHPGTNDLDPSTLDELALAKMVYEKWVIEDTHDDLIEQEDSDLGGKLERKLRKGEDWEEDWVAMEVGEWEDLEVGE